MACNPHFAVFSEVSLLLSSGIEVVCRYDGFIKKGNRYCLYKGIANGRTEYCVKFYTGKYPDEHRKINHDKVCRFIESRAKECQDGLPCMVGHGVATVWTGDGTGDYLYEILSFDAEHNVPFTDIGPISPKQLLEYLPQIVQSVRALHHAGFVHGSISPETIFVDGNGNIILSGFDGAQQMIQDNSAFSSSQDYTEYSAPEVYWNHICYSSDVFSIGMALLSLIHGEFIFKNELTVDSYAVVRAINQFIESNTLPMPSEWNNSDWVRKLRHLILGCLQEKPENRFTLEDIDSFCKHPETWNPPVIKQQCGADSFVLWDNSRVFTRGSLLKRLSSDWNKSLVFIKTGHMELSLAKAGLMREAAFVHEARETIRNKSRVSADILLSQCLSIIHPDSSDICYKGTIFRDLCDLALKSQVDEIARRYAKELLEKKFISWYAKQHGYADISDIAKMESMACCQDEITSDVGLWTFIYSYSKKSDEGWKRPETETEWQELFDQFIPDGNRAFQVLSNTKALGWLNYCRGLVDDIPRSEKIADFEKVTALFRMFLAKCPEHVKAAFKAYGPYAFFSYLQTHVEDYDFSRCHALLKEKIIACKINDGMIEAYLEQRVDSCINDTIAETELLYTQFFDALNNNLLAFHLGLRVDQKKITPRTEDAFLTEHYCAQIVSLGFVKYLQNK